MSLTTKSIHPKIVKKYFFLLSDFRHCGSSITDFDDPLTLIEKLGSSIKMIENNITENDYRITK